jgi:hypothetical protein
MDLEAGFGEKSRLKALLAHFSRIEDPRPSHRVAYKVMVPQTVVRQFAINHVRIAPEPVRPERSGLRRKTNKPPVPKSTSVRLRRKLAEWDLDYLASTLDAKIR